MISLRLLSLLALLPLAALRADTPDASQPAEPDCCATVKTCPVSGEELGSMGDPYVHVYRQDGQPDRKVELCCKMCVRRFEKDPAKYLAKVDAAAKASGPACCAAPAPEPAKDA